MGTLSAYKNASGTQSGLVSTGAQTFSGAKTFLQAVTASVVSSLQGSVGALTSGQNSGDLFAIPSGQVYLVHAAQVAATGVGNYRLAIATGRSGNQIIIANIAGSGISWEEGSAGQIRFSTSVDLNGPVWTALRIR